MSVISRTRIVSSAISSAPKGLPIGISIGSDSALTGLGDNGLAQYQIMKVAGFWGIRVDAPYPSGPGANVEASIKAALAAGLDVLLILDGYQTSVGVSAFTTFCTSMVDTYSPLGIHNYEILNEPNGSGAWDSTDNYVNPSGYTTLAAAVYSAVKAADPHSFVILGASAVLASSDGASEGSGNYLSNLLPATWIGLIYQANGGNTTGLCDAIGMHPYPAAIGAPSTTNNWGVFLNPPGTNSFYQVNYTVTNYGFDSVLAVMIANGEGAKPIWITECGYSTSNVSNTVQATNNAACINLAKAISNVDSFFIFNWNDDTDGNYGLVNSSYVAKPSLAAVEGLVTSVPSKLAYTTAPPATVGTGVPFTVVVALQDANGNTQTTNSTTPVTLSAGGGFSCSSPPTHFTNGVATFPNCTFSTTAGSPDTIIAVSGNLTAATFSTTVTAGPSGSTPVLNVVAGTTLGAPASSYTWNHTVGSSTNRLLLVAIEYNGAGICTGVTYGGTAMTLLVHVTTGGTSPDRACDTYYMIAPPSGTAAVVVSFNPADEPSGSSGKSMDYHSVYQVSPFGTPVTTETSSVGSSISATVTTASTNLILAFLAYKSGTAATYTTGSAIFTAQLAGTNGMLQGSSQAGGTSVASTFNTSSVEGVQAAMQAVALVGA